MSQLPQPVTDYIDRLRRVFGIPEWYVKSILVDHPGGDENTGAICGAEQQYLQAHLEVSREVLDSGDDAYIGRVIRHEVLHIVFARLDALVEEVIIRKMLPRPMRAAAIKLYSDALEETIQRLCKPLGEVLPYGEEGSNVKPKGRTGASRSVQKTAEGGPKRSTGSSSDGRRVRSRASGQDQRSRRHR